MPTYEYACRQCEEHFEVVQSFSEDALTVCPGCSGDLRKVFSAAGLIFKGSGWHVKDYATSSRATTASKGDSDTTAGTGTKSESGTKGGSGDAKTDSSTGSGTSTASAAKSGSTGTASTGTASTEKRSA